MSACRERTKPRTWAASSRSALRRRRRLGFVPAESSRLADRKSFIVPSPPGERTLSPVKTIGIAAHSAEGAALCFLTACHEGSLHLGPHLHPTIVMSAIPMGLSMEGWETGDHATVGRHLAQGVRQVADAGADFYVCPDNTAHIVLEKIASDLPIPGLHIAEVVCREIEAQGFRRVGLLGTKWTMTGPVYARALGER